MRILALNWRDVRSPEAGGSESHLHEILRRLVERGHAATLLCSQFARSPGPVREIVDGIETIRVGACAAYVDQSNESNYGMGPQVVKYNNDTRVVNEWSPNWRKRMAARQVLIDKTMDPDSTKGMIGTDYGPAGGSFTLPEGGRGRGTKGSSVHAFLFENGVVCPYRYGGEEADLPGVEELVNSPNRSTQLK